MKRQPLNSSSHFSKVTRRRFLGGAAALGAAGVLGFPAILRARGANEKLNIAMIACGGRGRANLNEFKGENIVALCDVNQKNIDAAKRNAPNARTFTDYRKLYDTLKDGEFDAVVVSTPESHHAFATLPALLRKKHVYCEKPLTRDVYEARVVADVAKQAGVATQMGTQGHASDNGRRVVELIDAGAIGPVTECHVWVDRTWGRQTEDEAHKYHDIVWTWERPAEEMPVPPYLDWDLWIGPAPMRPFNEVYFPGPKWYRWWDFGNGTMSDLGSHWNDLPWWALRLDAPKTIEAFGPPPHPELAPATMKVVYEYGQRGDRPPVTLTWYQGQMKPPQWEQNQIPRWKDGRLFVGSKGMILSDHARHVLLPEEKFKDYQRPPKTIPSAPGSPPSHHLEWLLACKTGSPTGSPFAGYAGPVTEANHLGNVAHRAGRKIEWDPKDMRIPNCPEAERFLRREYRKGWSLGAQVG